MSEDSEEIVPQDPTELLKDDGNPPVTTSVVIGAWEGPLPPPIILEQYGQIIEDAPNRILTLVESQVNHRIYTERAQIKISGWGLAVGSLLTFMLAGGGLWLIYIGHIWPGVSVIGIDLAGISWVYVYGTKIQSGRNK